MGRRAWMVLAVFAVGCSSEVDRQPSTEPEQVVQPTPNRGPTPQADDFVTLPDADTMIDGCAAEYRVGKLTQTRWYTLSSHGCTHTRIVNEQQQPKGFQVVTELGAPTYGCVVWWAFGAPGAETLDWRTEVGWRVTAAEGEAPGQLPDYGA